MVLHLGFQIITHIRVCYYLGNIPRNTPQFYFSYWYNWIEAAIVAPFMTCNFCFLIFKILKHFIIGTNIILIISS